MSKSLGSIAFLAALTANALSASAQCASGQLCPGAVAITCVGGGTVSNISCTAGSFGGTRIAFTADPNPGPAMTVIIRVLVPNYQIDEIAVNVPASNEQAVITVRADPGGSISRLYSMNKSGSGELWITRVDVGTGQIGSSTATTAITANSIDTIEADGSIYSDITSTGGAASVGTIARIESDFGSIFGNIQANSGVAILRANNGTIGSSTDTVTIKHKVT